MDLKSKEPECSRKALQTESTVYTVKCQAETHRGRTIVDKRSQSSDDFEDLSFKKKPRISAEVEMHRSRTIAFFGNAQKSSTSVIDLTNDSDSENQKPKQELLIVESSSQSSSSEESDNECKECDDRMSVESSSSTGFRIREQYSASPDLIDGFGDMDPLFDGKSQETDCLTSSNRFKSTLRKQSDDFVLENKHRLQTSRRGFRSLRHTYLDLKM